MPDATSCLGRAGCRRPASGHAHGPWPEAAGSIASAPRAGAGQTAKVHGALGVAAPTLVERARDGHDATQPMSDAPVLRLAGYEGPLDALLDQARAGRVDLRQLSLLAVIEQCVAALDVALSALRDAVDDGSGRGGATSGAATMPALVPLQRLAEWVGMAAWLAWLRTRLLLPEDDLDARAARAEADAFRRGLARRAAVQDAADWLDGRPQLGRDVFVGGAVADAAREDAERAASEFEALLRAYTRRIDPAAAPGQGRVAATYRPRPPRLWRVQDALAHIERLLGAVPNPEAPNNASLWRFLPDAEDLAAAGLAPDAVQDTALLGRSAVASTLVAGLELARGGVLRLAQEEWFGDLVIGAAAEHSA